MYYHSKCQKGKGMYHCYECQKGKGCIITVNVKRKRNVLSLYKRKQNVSVYSLKSPLSSADFTIYAPGIGTLSYTVSSPLGRIQHLRTLLQL